VSDSRRTDNFLRKPLKKISRSKRNKLKAYFPLANEHLAAHPFCEACASEGRVRRATEVHHFQGRGGRLLTDPRFFVSSCYGCRLWFHDHPAIARERGLLATAQAWQTYPEEGVAVALPTRWIDDKGAILKIV
jgi:hypothetical protein